MIRNPTEQRVGIFFFMTGVMLNMTLHPHRKFQFETCGHVNIRSVTVSTCERPWEIEPDF